MTRCHLGPNLQKQERVQRASNLHSALNPLVLMPSMWRDKSSLFWLRSMFLLSVLTVVMGMETDAPLDLHHPTLGASASSASPGRAPDVNIALDLTADVEPFAADPPQPPNAPNNLIDLFQWAGQYVQSMSRNSMGRAFLENMKSNLNMGIQFNTDYSGFGGPEIALKTIVKALSDYSSGGLTTDVLLWRASDVLPSRRKMLRSGGAGIQPLHIFGDVLMRVSRLTRSRLRGVLESTEADFNAVVGEIQSTEELKLAAEELGKTMMNKLIEVMKKQSFDLGRLAWCYRCKRLCRVHGPLPCDAAAAVHVAVAGTTCTSWSSMGSKIRWLASSALPFVVWAFETLAWGPHCIIHECTARLAGPVEQVVFKLQNTCGGMGRRCVCNDGPACRFCVFGFKTVWVTDGPC
jgi:hypothetical protein